MPTLGTKMIEQINSNTFAGRLSVNDWVECLFKEFQPNLPCSRSSLITLLYYTPWLNGGTPMKTHTLPCSTYETKRHRIIQSCFEQQTKPSVVNAGVKAAKRHPAQAKASITCRPLWLSQVISVMSNQLNQNCRNLSGRYLMIFNIDLIIISRYHLGLKKWKENIIFLVNHLIWRRSEECTIFSE